MFTFVLLFALAFATLPTDQSACQAAPGAKWNTDVCECDTVTGFETDSEGTEDKPCKCSDATKNIIKSGEGSSVTYTCDSCPNGQNYDQATMTCYTPAPVTCTKPGQADNNGQCECIVTGFETDSEGTEDKPCKCSDATKYIIKTDDGNSVTYACGTCTNGQNYDQATMTCYTPAICEQQGQIADKDKCVCDTTNGFEKKDGTGEGIVPLECKFKCGVNQVWDSTLNENEGGCKCEDNHIPFGTLSVCVEEKICIDKLGFKKTNGVCNCKTNGDVFFADAGKCIPQTDCKADNGNEYVQQIGICMCSGDNVYLETQGKCITEAECTANPKFEIKEEECVCKNGYEFNEGSDKATNPCVCPSSSHEIVDATCYEKCGTNQERNSDKECKCKDNHIPFGDLPVCVEEAKCIDTEGFKKTNGVCGCKEQNYVFFAEALKCIPKDDCDAESGMEAFGDACECKENHVRFGDLNLCVAAAECQGNGLGVDADTKVCKCSESGKFAFADKGACVPEAECTGDGYLKTATACTCANGYVYLGVTGKCIAQAECKAEKHLGLNEDDDCVCINGYSANSGANAADSPCVCEATHEEKTVDGVMKCVEKTLKCDKPHQGFKDETKTECVCKDGYSTNTGANAAESPCVCPTTHEEKTENGVTKCVEKTLKCGENEELKGGKCECKQGFSKGSDGKCVSDGVNGLFLILAFVLFFLF